MMAMSEERPDEVRAAGVKTVVLSIVLGLVMLLALGILIGAGYALATGEVDPGEMPITIGLGIVGGLALLVAVVGLVRLKPWAGSGEPMSAKTRKANNLLLLSGALGGVIGAALSIATISMDDPFTLFSTAPLPPAVIIPALVVWLLIVPAISWQWHRSIDEHETQSYHFGGIVALYLYAFLAPAWWFAWRGGLVPAPDTMVVYLIVMSIWGLGWFWRRYR